MKDIPGYEGLYAITKDGKVFSKKRKIYLSPKLVQGYSHVSLCLSGIIKQKKIHRLVALTYINNPENKKEVNHKNGIKHDNRVENLEWCTRSENALHSYKTGLQKTTEKQRAWSSKLGKMKGKQIQQIDSFNNIVGKYISIAEAGIKTNIARTAINNCLKGLSKSAGKFRWSYINNI